MNREEVLEKLKYFDDEKFVFDAEKHLYKLGKKNMIGCTTYLSRFIKEFDSDYWSKKKADEEGITQEEMLKRWDDKRDRSCELGTDVHEHIEKFYKNSEFLVSKDGEVNERLTKFKAIYDTRLIKLESIACEIRVFSKKWGLAGTIDKLFLYENALIVGDWKTNAKIKTDKDFCFGKLLAPFDNLKDNEINKYSLQISLYMLMLEEAGIICDYGFICHIPKDKEAKIYRLKDFRSELRTHLSNADILETAPIVKLSENKFEKLW